MKLEVARQIFGKSSNIKFHQNPFSRSRVVPWGQMDRQIDGRTDNRLDMMKLIIAFHNFENALKSNRKNTDNVRITQYWRASTKSFLPLKSNKYCRFTRAFSHLGALACLRVCTCSYARVCECICAGAWGYACACSRVVLLIQHAKRMRHIFICNLSRFTIFLTLFHKRHDFRRKKILNIKCASICYSNFVWNTSFSNKNSARYCHKYENFFV